MPLRPPAGFISAFFDPLNNPNAPTIGTATDASTGGTISVAFTAPANVGGSAISSYSAISTPQGIIASAASSPISVTGLTNGTAYTFAVWATNTYGPSAYSAASNSASPSAPLAVFAGGYNSSNSQQSTVQYVNIATTGDYSSFGNLIEAGYQGAGFGSTTRGIYGGFYNSGDVNIIQYITFSTTGNTTDFGDMISANRLRAGFNSATRGIFAGGATIFGGESAAIEYVTMASTGNGTNFGDLLGGGKAAGFSSPTRGVCTRSPFSSVSNIIEYVTIATTSNATDFGDLTVARAYMGTGSNSTRGIFCGGGTAAGSTAINVIDYVTIASTGNATDFGDTVPEVTWLAGASSATRVVFAGARDISATSINWSDYVTIASTGNSVDFGSLVTSSAGFCGGCSNTNGGLQ
jgi:hypothetical protein